MALLTPRSHQVYTKTTNLEAFFVKNDDEFVQGTKCTGALIN